MADGTCSVGGCNHPAFCRSWCHTHYNRWHRSGDVQAGKPIRFRREPAQPGEMCEVAECGRQMIHRPWCAAHHQRWLKLGDVLADLPLKSPGRPMGTVPCSVVGCRNASRTRGWCHAHYRRWRQTGDPLADVNLRLRGESDEVRFWAKVDKEGPLPARAPHLGSCFLWTGGLNSTGYGVFNLDGQPVGAHRAAWILASGVQIPDGLVIDHLCGTRHCVRKSHLEPVTQRTNMHRSPRVVAAAAQRRCPKGHLRADDEQRGCRQCVRDGQRALREKLTFDAAERGPRLVMDAELARTVAAVYRAAVAVGNPPVVAVSKHFRRSHGQACVLVRFARKQGALETDQSGRRYRRGLLPSGEIVYFVERNGFIKIGMTADLKNRLLGLRAEDRRAPAAGAGPVRVLACMPGGRNEEKRLHQKFAHLRIGGEWFRPDPSLMSAVRLIAGGAIPELALLAA